MVGYANLHEWQLSDNDDRCTDDANPSRKSLSFEYGTRLPFLVVSGQPNSRVIDQVVPPYRAVGGSAPVTPLCPILPKVGRKTEEVKSIAFLS